MDTIELEARWKLISHTGFIKYRLLRISPVCIPELYLALDIEGNRSLVLQVPEDVEVFCPSINLENLSIEWHDKNRLVIIGLREGYFSDLFNEFVISMYNRLKDCILPDKYTNEFISNFNRWRLFFDVHSSNQLSEIEIKGLFGELIVLRWFLLSDSVKTTDSILEAWQGPYGRPQDFIFISYNLEVKTKNTDDTYIHISSEYQLQVESGKKLQLGVVSLKNSDDNTTLNYLILEIKKIILSNGGDLSIFLRAISRTGINIHNLEEYNDFKWTPLSITLYDCDGIEFPKIIPSLIHKNIVNVKYNLTLIGLNPFIIQEVII
jgi:hypothetical protein